MKHISLLILCTIFTSFSFSQTGGDAIVYTDQYLGEKIEYFFYDIKMNLNGINSTTKANELFVVDDMNGVRVSILGNDKDGMRAHPSAGTVVESSYTKMISSIKRAQTARGDKDFYIFASKKMTSQPSFPDWTKDDDGVIVMQYLSMLDDYLSFMKAQGVEVDFLAIQNEEVYNEGSITAAKHADIIDALRMVSQTATWKMPKIVGYEDYGPSKAVISGQGSFVSNLSKLGKTDRMDIYGTHYYPQWRPLANLQKDQAYLGDMPFWSTEPHWDRKSAENDFDEAIPAIMTLWDQVEQRMSGFMWWDYTYYSTTEMRSNLMRAFSAPLKDAQAVKMDDIDGPFLKGVKKYNKLETYAFRGDGRLTVYVLNNTENIYTDYGIKLDQGSISSFISCQQWVKDGAVLGTTNAIGKTSEQQFNYDIPANSITAFNFGFQSSTAIKEHTISSQLKLYPSVSSDVVYLQNNKEMPYTVYSINGIEMLNSNEDKIDISKWAKGVYFLRSNAACIKFIKN